MDWSEQFENYINSYKDIYKFSPEDLKNVKDIEKTKKNPKHTQILYNVKLQSDWINGKEITFSTKYYFGQVNKYMLFLNENSYIINNIKSIFDSFYNKDFSYSKNKYNQKSFKINNISESKLKYFLSCKFDEKTEYIKFTPDFKLENICQILTNCKFKILCVPWIIQNSNNYMIGLKIESIVIDYNKNLLKYKSIKDMIDIVVRNKKKEIKENTRNDIKLEYKFNKYKYKNTKIDESNNRILDLINNLHIL